MRRTSFKIFIIFCLLVAILFGWKWNTWFGNPIELPYETPNHPDRIMLSLGENADTDRAISWRCDTLLADSWVYLVNQTNKDTSKFKAQGTIVSSPGGKNTFYRCDLKQLQISDYSYQVVTNQIASKWFNFSINDKDDAFTFAYLGDIQDKVDGVSDTIFNHINKEYPDLDFWLFVGDMIERPLDKYWNTFFNSGDAIFNQKPIIACTGNHEYYKALFKKLDKRWVHYWPLPTNGPKAFEGRACHWEIENACIVSLDTDGVQGIRSYNSQYAWAKEILKNTTKTWKIVFLHHPIKSAGAGRSTIIMETLFKKLMVNQGVDIVLQGHDHSYSRYSTKKDDAKTFPIFVSSTCSPKVYDISIDDDADRLGSSINVYQIIDITKDKLNLKTFTLDDQYYDGFSITKDKQGKSFVEEMPNTPESLEPSPRFIRKKSEKEIEEYYLEVKERHQKQLNK